MINYKGGEDRYLSHRKCIICLDGPDTDGLVSSGLLVHPYPEEVSQEFLPIEATPFRDFCVIVTGSSDKEEDLDEVFERMNLDSPTITHAIRFVSQVRGGDASKFLRKHSIIFPSKVPHRTRQGDDVYLGAAWCGQRGCFELRFYAPRFNWDSETYLFVGVATHLREHV